MDSPERTDGELSSEPDLVDWEDVAFFLILFVVLLVLVIGTIVAAKAVFS